MPIKIPDGLPARSVLENENIFVMTEKRALHQDIRPLKIALLNLMPQKIETECQILRLLGNSPLQVELTLLQTSTYKPKNTPQRHLELFYKFFDDIKTQKLDGLVITGAPVETLEFEQVGYWDELKEIMDWSLHSVYSTFHICWGAQAGLYYHYGVKKEMLPAKLCGVFEHKVLKSKHKLVRGFDERFLAPHSRYSAVCDENIKNCAELELLAASKEAGAYIIASKNGRQFFITGHSEYDADTLKNEYLRDVQKGVNPQIPLNYFPNDDAKKTPLHSWRAHANLLYNNWLNYFVYQTTPYDSGEIK